MGSRIAMGGEEWNTNSAANMVGWSLTGRREVMRLLSVQTPGTVPNDIPLKYLSPGGNIRPQVDLTNNRRTLEIAVLRVDRSLLKALHGRGGLKHNARRREVVANFWANRGFGEVDWPSYFLILRDLVNGLNPGPGFFEPRPVYACGYDWRQSNTDSARTLEARINQAFDEHPSAERVIIVTHSMGGLVTRAMLAAGRIPESKIAGVVHTVMPADGASVAYRRFLTGAIEGTDEQQEANGDEPIDGPGPFRSILGPDRTHYALTQSGLRGPTELLPHQSFPDVFVSFDGSTNLTVGNVYNDIFLTTQTRGGCLPEEGDVTGEFVVQKITVSAADITALRTRITEARKFSESVAGVVHPRTFLIVGTGHQTDIGIDLRTLLTTPDFQFLDRITRDARGDGTVPQASAEFQGATINAPFTRTRIRAEHATCFGHETDGPAFRAAVVNRCQRLH